MPTDPLALTDEEKAELRELCPMVHEPSHVCSYCSVARDAFHLGRAKGWTEAGELLYAADRKVADEKAAAIRKALEEQG